MLMAGDISDKIKAIRLSLGLNQTEFAERIGATQSTVARWERGAMPKGSMLQVIADLANTTVERLLGQSVWSEEDADALPVVGYVGGGAEVLPFDDYAKGRGMDYIERPAGIAGEAVALEVRGDSMFPTAENGWRLIYTGEQTVLERATLIVTMRKCALQTQTM